MASKSSISRSTRFSKFREHVRRWAFERTKDLAQRLTHFCLKAACHLLGQANWPDSHSTQFLRGVRGALRIFA